MGHGSVFVLARANLKIYGLGIVEVYRMKSVGGGLVRDRSGPYSREASAVASMWLENK